MLALDRESEWKVPIVLTEAMRGEGVPELWDALTRAPRSSSRQTATLEERRRANLAAEVFAVASARAKTHIEEAVAEDPALAACSKPSRRASSTR